MTLAVVKSCNFPAERECFRLTRSRIGKRQCRRVTNAPTAFGPAPALFVAGLIQADTGIAARLALCWIAVRMPALGLLLRQDDMNVFRASPAIPAAFALHSVMRCC